MKWKGPITKRKEKIYRQGCEYTTWFAWYPVKLEYNKTWVWLERVEFIRVGLWSVPEYREIKGDKNAEN